MTNELPTPEGDWLHQTESDYSPITGAVAACRTCGWGEPFDHATKAKAAAEAHRDKYGRAAAPTPPEPQPRKRPGPVPTVQHGSATLYNRGCRCEACKAAKSAYRKARAAAGVSRRAR